jgi:hypothetical protein
MGPVRAQRCPARLHVLHSHTGAWFRSEAGSTRRQTYTAASLRVSRPIWSRVCKASHRRFRGGPRSGLPCVRAPKPRRPPRARHRAVNSTPTRRPCSATDGAAANSPPVRSRSRLLAIASPRLTTTGWGPGRYAARASAGPIRNSILSKHLRQLGDVRRDAAGLVPPRPARA